MAQMGSNDSFAEAERLAIDTRQMDPDDRAPFLEQAQVFATLALAESIQSLASAYLQVAYDD
jgi:hypothetical protein